MTKSYRGVIIYNSSDIDPFTQNISTGYILLVVGQRGKLFYRPSGSSTSVRIKTKKNYQFTDTTNGEVVTVKDGDKVSVFNNGTGKGKSCDTCKPGCGCSSADGISTENAGGGLGLGGLSGLAGILGSQSGDTDLCAQPKWFAHFQVCNSTIIVPTFTTEDPADDVLEITWGQPPTSLSQRYNVFNTDCYGSFSEDNPIIFKTNQTSGLVNGFQYGDEIEGYPIAVVKANLFCQLGTNEVDFSVTFFAAYLYGNNIPLTRSVAECTDEYTSISGNFTIPLYLVVKLYEGNDPSDCYLKVAIRIVTDNTLASNAFTIRTRAIEFYQIITD